MAMEERVESSLEQMIEKVEDKVKGNSSNVVIDVKPKSKQQNKSSSVKKENSIEMQRLVNSTQELEKLVNESRDAAKKMTGYMDDILKAAEMSGASSIQSLHSAESIEDASENANQKSEKALEKIDLLQTFLRSSAMEINSMVSGISEFAKVTVASAKNVISLVEAAGPNNSSCHLPGISTGLQMRLVRA